MTLGSRNKFGKPFGKTEGRYKETVNGINNYYFIQTVNDTAVGTKRSQNAIFIDLTPRTHKMKNVLMTNCECEIQFCLEVSEILNIDCIGPFDIAPDQWSSVTKVKSNFIFYKLLLLLFFKHFSCANWLNTNTD